jgi:NADH-quinone oxidoreductase subunit G
MRVLPRENEDVNECWISDKDRFSYEALNSAERLHQADDSCRRRVARSRVERCARLRCACAEGHRKTHSAASIAALASPHSTLEELYSAARN